VLASVVSLLPPRPTTKRPGPASPTPPPPAPIAPCTALHIFAALMSHKVKIAARLRPRLPGAPRTPRTHPRSLTAPRRGRRRRDPGRPRRCRRRVHQRPQPARRLAGVQVPVRALAACRPGRGARRGAPPGSPRATTSTRRRRPSSSATCARLSTSCTRASCVSALRHRSARSRAPQTVTVFAYGVTSSGKTHTMQGIPNQPGLIPRTVEVRRRPRAPRNRGADGAPRPCSRERPTRRSPMRYLACRTSRSTRTRCTTCS
jgi:hypothetical protein